MANLEELSIELLIRRSLDSSFEAEEEVGNKESWAAWEAIWALARRAGNEVLQAGKELLVSTDPWHRSRGATILGQFEKELFPDDRLAALSAAIGVETDDRVVTSIVYAMGHLHDLRILPVLLKFAYHPNAEVRLSVAMSLEAEWGNEAVTMLCELCSDESASVRDWATFKFRTSKVDTDSIRQCLTARLQDSDPTTRAEAICALAYRRDLACLKGLVDDLANLEAFDDYYCLIEAAHQLLGLDPEDERSPEFLRDELLRKYSPL